MWLSHQGALSEDGLLAHLRVLQALLSQLPVSPTRASGQDAASDSDEEEGEEADRPASAPVSPQLCVCTPCAPQASSLHPRSHVWARTAVRLLSGVNQEHSLSVELAVQSLSRGRLFATPWTAAGQGALSFTTSRSVLRFTSIESAMTSNHFILCHPLLPLPSVLPRIKVFSNAETCSLMFGLSVPSRAALCISLIIIQDTTLQVKLLG